MSDLKTKLYQMFILGTEGDGYIKALERGLGGIIFFTKDIQTPEQFKNLILKIKSIAAIPPFLSIDQEGGRVERSENIHNGKKYLSAKKKKKKGEDFLKKQTKEIAQELKSYGINLNFAPCIDVNTNPNNPIIGERAFSNNPDEVIKGETIVSQTYRENGIIPCVKHFPGHGDANADSHLTLPEINLSLKEMERTHIKPFAACAKTIEMVMVAHLHCTCFEKEVIPTSLSKNAISYLRNKLGFDGVIISDDMIMKGVTNAALQKNASQTLQAQCDSLEHKINACEMGIRAGLNMFIYRNSTLEIIEMIETIAKKALTDKELQEKIEYSFEKITKLKSNPQYQIIT